MSPEERAARFSWQQCPGGPGHDPGDEGFSYTCAKCSADLIRAAENEALERAAKSVALMGWTIVGGVDVASVEARILALKSKPPEGK